MCLLCFPFAATSHGSHLPTRAMHMISGTSHTFHPCTIGQPHLASDRPLTQSDRSTRWTNLNVSTQPDHSTCWTNLNVSTGSNPPERIPSLVMCFYRYRIYPCGCREKFISWKCTYADLPQIGKGHSAAHRRDPNRKAIEADWPCPNQCFKWKNDAWTKPDWKTSIVLRTEGWHKLFWR